MNFEVKCHIEGLRAHCGGGGGSRILENMLISSLNVPLSQDDVGVLTIHFSLFTTVWHFLDCNPAMNGCVNFHFQICSSMIH